MKNDVTLQLKPFKGPTFSFILHNTRNRENPNEERIKYSFTRNRCALERRDRFKVKDNYCFYYLPASCEIIKSFLSCSSDLLRYSLHSSVHEAANMYPPVSGGTK